MEAIFGNLGAFSVFSGNSKNNKNVLIRLPEVIWSGLEAIFGNLGGIFGVSRNSENNKNVQIRPPEVIWSGLEAIFGNLGAFLLFLEKAKIMKMI